MTISMAWNYAIHSIFWFDHYFFWLWPILYVTQMARVIHYFPQRKEDPWAYRRAVVLSALFLLLTISIALFAETQH